MDTADPDLYQRTKALLEPGEVELQGVIVHTDLPREEDIAMMERTLAAGDAIAEHAGHDPDDTYVYSGNDDPEFASNQHQCRTLAGEEFVWECQQLLREGTYDLVFYYEATADQEAILAALGEMDVTVTGVE